MSRPGFLSCCVIKAVFVVEGTVPVDKEGFVMLIVAGPGPLEKAL